MKHLDGLTDGALDAMNTDQSEEVQGSSQEVESYDAPAPQEDEVNSQEASADESQRQVAEAVADLSKFTKVKLGDKEFTPDELSKGYMMQSDYTRKTQELAKERKYYDNLQVDLRAVAKDPSLAGEFKKVYPEKFHQYLEFLGGKAQAPQQKSTQGQLDPEVQERLNRYDEVIGQFQQKIQEDNLKAMDAKLQGIESELNQKYPHADPIYAYTLAQEARSKWERENGQKFTPDQINKEWMEAFWKQSNDHQVKLFNKYQQDKAAQAKKNNQQASDIGRGGATPGGAPKKIKLNDVADYILNEEMG